MNHENNSIVTEISSQLHKYQGLSCHSNRIQKHIVVNNFLKLHFDHKINLLIRGMQCFLTFSGSEMTKKIAESYFISPPWLPMRPEVWSKMPVCMLFTTLFFCFYHSRIFVVDRYKVIGAKCAIFVPTGHFAYHMHAIITRSWLQTTFKY